MGKFFVWKEGERQRAREIRATSPAAAAEYYASRIHWETMREFDALVCVEDFDREAGVEVRRYKVEQTYTYRSREVLSD